MHIIRTHNGGVRYTEYKSVTVRLQVSRVRSFAVGINITITEDSSVQLKERAGCEDGVFGAAMCRDHSVEQGTVSFQKKLCLIAVLISLDNVSNLVSGVVTPLVTVVDSFFFHSIWQCPGQPGSGSMAR